MVIFSGYTSHQYCILYARDCVLILLNASKLKKRWHTSSDTLMGSLLSSFFSWFSVSITWPQKPARVVVQRRGPLKNTEPETISLHTLIETRCPSVLTPFEEVWWLFKYAHSLLRHCVTQGLLTQQTCSGHLQTGYALVDELSRADPVVYGGSSLYCF